MERRILGKKGVGTPRRVTENMGHCFPCPARLHLAREVLRKRTFSQSPWGLVFFFTKSLAWGEGGRDAPHFVHKRFDGRVNSPICRRSCNKDSKITWQRLEKGFAAPLISWVTHIFGVSQQGPTAIFQDLFCILTCHLETKPLWINLKSSMRYVE